MVGASIIRCALLGGDKIGVIISGIGGLGGGEGKVGRVVGGMLRSYGSRISSVFRDGLMSAGWGLGATVPLQEGEVAGHCM